MLFRSYRLLFGPFKDMKDDQLFEEEEIAAGGKDNGKEEDDMANILVVFPLIFLCFVGFMSTLAL